LQQEKRKTLEGGHELKLYLRKNKEAERRIAEGVVWRQTGC